MPTMVLRTLAVASILASAMCITNPSIGLSEMTPPNKDSGEFSLLYQDAQTVDAAVNWGDKVYFFKDTRWISWDKTNLRIDDTFPRPIEEGFPELNAWLYTRDVPADQPKSLLGYMAKPAKISAAAILPPNPNRVLSPTKPVAVFFKFVAPSAGTDGAIATRGSNNYHVCAYEASGTYGAFLGAYPSHVDQLVYGAYGTGVTFPEANASALMADLGISTGLTDYFDRLGARMDFGSAVSLLDDTGMPVAVPFYQCTDAAAPCTPTNMDMLITYNQIEKRVVPTNPLIAAQKIPVALMQTADGMQPRPLVATTLAEAWMPAWRAMIPCWDTTYCVGATATKKNSFYVFSSSVFWLVQVQTVGTAPKLSSKLEFWSDTEVNTMMGTTSLYNLATNWPKITEMWPDLADFCEPRSTYALASMKVTFNPPELTGSTGDSDASDGSLSLCQITSRIGDIQVFFKLYSKSGLIIYQSQATVTTDTKKSEICLRVEDTTPACDYLIPEKSAGAVTGKVFVTTTSVETPAVERNYRYEREQKEIISWQYEQSVF